VAEQRPYTYYDFTLSLCTRCLRRVEAKVVLQDGNVYLLKRCGRCGGPSEKVLIATDEAYYRRVRNYMKRSEMPRKFGTRVAYGCPYDCGLCTDHEQHSCLAIVEVTDRCNLTCPTCYAFSSPTHGRHRTLEEIEWQLDKLVEHEGSPDVVQLSGGEPTIHPDFFAILDAARARPIGHLMVNTNGIRIAEEEGFAERLAAYAPGFEVYLQFDSFRPEALKSLRGANLARIRQEALEKLNRLNLSTTLVVTLQKGLNDDEIGAILDFAVAQPCVRGVTFQPTQVAGRVEHFDPATDRITLTEVRQAILDQSTLFAPEDLLPVPCNPDALVMGYALKLGGEVLPLTRFFDPDQLLDSTRNTISFEADRALVEQAVGTFSTGIGPERASEQLQHLLCCLPGIDCPGLSYDNVFRVIIMRFMDAYDFDVRAVKKSCVHIVHPDGRLIPFETMNLFYRTPEQAAYLETLREERVYV
jgi:7,8-dihydro-6-hydroxymethylpterin dimethyltransferase